MFPRLFLTTILRYVLSIKTNCKMGILFSCFVLKPQAYRSSKGSSSSSSQLPWLWDVLPSCWISLVYSLRCLFHHLLFYFPVIELLYFLNYFIFDFIPFIPFYSFLLRTRIFVFSLFTLSSCPLHSCWSNISYRVDVQSYQKVHYVNEYYQFWGPFSSTFWDKSVYLCQVVDLF